MLMSSGQTRERSCLITLYGSTRPSEKLNRSVCRTTMSINTSGHTYLRRIMQKKKEKSRWFVSWLHAHKLEDLPSLETAFESNNTAAGQQLDLLSITAQWG